jgi:ATP-dependent DNA ligase
MAAATTMPQWLEPMAATLTQERFSGPGWVFERKFDGIRLLAYKRGDDVQLFSRNQLPQHVPAIAAAVAGLPVRELILDGEMAWDPSTPDHALGAGGRSYHVFDILWLDGRPVTSLPLEDRRALLKELPFRLPLRRVDLVDDDRPWEIAAREGWEGVIAKRRGSPYEHRRSKHWLKMKCEASQALVVGGFTDPQGTRVGLGALLVGYYAPRPGSAPPDRRPEDDGEDFVFAGKIGTGFDTRLLLDLRRRLDVIELRQSPFTRATGLPKLRAHWVHPRIVVQAGFIEWTVHGKLRHPRLLGVRFDKNARDVVREAPVDSARGQS